MIRSKELLVLETYPTCATPHDGLSGVFNLTKQLGPIVPDTSHIQGAIVLVSGIAHMYEDKLSADNINIINTTFESDRLPDSWVSAINKYQYCIVPHDAIRQMFQSSGIYIPIEVVPLGYTRYPQPEVAAATTPEFVVGFLGIPVNRKNLLLLYEACRQLQQSHIPNLRLKVHVAEFYSWLDPAPFRDMQQDNIVEWTTGKLPPEQVAAWYKSLSCYVFPSSGEGWSYTPRESMAMAVPTIITDIPVHRELIESGYCKQIDVAGKVPADFGGAFYGNWDKVETEAIRNAIINVYQQHEVYKEKAIAGAAWIKDKWPNEELVSRLKNIVEKIGLLK